jgi:hypothetical protein
MARITIEFPRTPATQTGTPPWIKAVPARDKLVRLRALATEALSIWNDLRSWSTYLRQQLNMLIGDKDTDTCTILQNIDKLYNAYVSAQKRINEIRQEINALLADPEVQMALPESLVSESYRAKKEDYHFVGVIFSNIPPKEPTVRTEFINNLADLQSKYEQAKNDYNLYAPMAAKGWESSTERLQVEARIAQAVERLIPAIRDYKAGKISEAEFDARVNKEVLDAAADIAKIVQTWATEKDENAKRALDAQSKMTAIATKIKQLTRECPQLKDKYNVIDKPEGWEEWLRKAGLT